jgi:GPH family glycoside/pentoside/hexuronide:cation symporter
LHRVAALLPIFYQDYLGLNASWIALASVIYGVWNALNDPVFGFISDSTRSKHRRRIPYMRYTAPFLALSFILVWLAPQPCAMNRAKGRRLYPLFVDAGHHDSL